MSTEPAADALAVARATNQRLNRRAQELEAELATYRRAVAQWEINKRGTYIPHASLRAIGLASGRDILGSVRHLKHFERVEQAEAAIERVRRLHDALDAETDLTSPDDEITRGAAAKKIAAALDGWRPPAVPVPPPTDRAAVLREAADRIDREDLPQNGVDCFDNGARWATKLLRRLADEAPLSPYYSHEACGFHWHGRDGMDIPMRDGQPVCPRCELRRVEKLLDHRERRCEELRAESKRRGKNVLEYAEKTRLLERDIDGVRSQLGAEILRAGQAEAELCRLAAEAPTTTKPEAHACANCEGIDPDTCLMNPNRPPEQCPNSEFDGYGLQCQKEAGHNLCTFEEQPAARVRQDGAEENA